MEHDKIVKAEMRAALDECLSYVDDLPSLHRDIMRKARGETIVRRKLSVGLVFMIVLILAAITALAAITLNTLYEKTIEMEGQSGLIQDWSAEEKTELIHMMIDAGIQLDQEKVNLLSSDTLSSAEKDTLAMDIITDYYPARDGILSTVDIIAKEKGSIEHWSLEDHAWFSEMMDQYQPVEGRGKNMLPDDNAITQEEAKQIFFDYYQNEYGIEMDYYDLSTFTVAYRESTFDDGEAPPRRLEHWTFNVKSVDGSDWLGMQIAANDGEIINAVRPRFVITEDSWRDDWYDTEFSDDFWTIEGMCAFLEGWIPRVEEIAARNGFHLYDDLPYFVAMPFSIPDGSCITREEALSSANAQVVKHCGLHEDMLKYYLVREAFLRGDSERPVYFFEYLRNRASNELPEQDQEALRSVAVFIDGRTGEIIQTKDTAGMGTIETLTLILESI